MPPGVLVWAEELRREARVRLEEVPQEVVLHTPVAPEDASWAWAGAPPGAAAGHRTCTEP